MGKRIDPAADRTCKTCNQTLPPAKFYASGHGNGRRTTCIRCLLATQRAKASFHRHEKVNARGDVWCPSCERWLAPDAFKPHPSRTGSYWWQCTECQRVYDRQRYRAKAKTPAGKQARERRTERKRAARRRAFAERTKLVAGAIETLRRRGLTISEVARLVGVSPTNISRWTARDVRITAAVEARFVAALRVTAHLPAGEAPAYPRRRPHPELPALIERMRPAIEANPTRTRWGARP